MSAKEMFEKLGFRVNYKDDEILCDKKRFISDTDIIYINPKDKKIKALTISDSPFTPSVPYELSFDELQAINKQVEELGW